MLCSEQLAAWITLAKTPRVGAQAFQTLLDIFPDPVYILKASKSELSSAGIPPSLAASITRQTIESANSEIAWLEKNDKHHVMTLFCQDYPRLLKEISDPPPILYINGDRTLLNDPQLAMVGSRNPTHEGRNTALQFARHLSSQGLCITSGLALGIDGFSHQGALEVNAPTIAVMATGQDRVYPAKHRDLAHQIANIGALITEQPLGTTIHPGLFPRRNRIISGLSIGTLIVEATKKSGSLITARLAIEQGREVFAIPGSIHSPQAKGCHQIIRQGAKLVETAEHILEELAPYLELTAYTDKKSDMLVEKSEPNIDFEINNNDEHIRLLDCLGEKPLPIDLMVVKTGLTAEEISSMLLILELDDKIIACGGGLYKKKL